MKIAIVEDDKVFSDFIKKYLESNFSQCKIFISNSGKEFLNITEKEDITLAFIDINLPDMSGLTLLEILKKRKKNIKVVIITGHPDPNTKKKALEKGVVNYLVKPIGLKEIQDIVISVIEDTFDNEWKGVSLIDVLQFLAYQKGKWLVEVFDRESLIGYVFIDNSLIKTSRFRDKKGLEALYKLFSLKKLKHKIKKVEDIKKIDSNEINQPVEVILLQYIKELDESKHHKTEIAYEKFIEKISQEMREIKGYFIWNKESNTFQTDMNLFTSSKIKNIILKIQRITNLSNIHNLKSIIFEFNNGKLGIAITKSGNCIGIITTNLLHLGMLKVVIEDIYNFYNTEHDKKI